MELLRPGMLLITLAMVVVLVAMVAATWLSQHDNRISCCPRRSRMRLVGGRSQVYLAAADI
jgi:hypothetical protein